MDIVAEILIRAGKALFGVVMAVIDFLSIRDFFKEEGRKGKKKGDRHKSS